MKKVSFKSAAELERGALDLGEGQKVVLNFNEVIIMVMSSGGLFFNSELSVAFNLEESKCAGENFVLTGSSASPTSFQS